MKIPFLNFDPMHVPIKKDLIDAFEEFINSNWFVLGNGVKNFEEEYSNFNKIPYVVGVSNGLDALIISLKTLNIGPGDEVIVPSNTYIATALAVSHVGAKPVLVEPCIDTYNIDPNLIESSITKKTKAIMPVHLYGQSCKMDIIKSIANKYNIYVVEDNAQSQGASCDNKLTGTWGDVNATSFYPGKNLGAFGEAGAITTNNIKLAEEAKIYRNYGSQKKYYNKFLGYNMRLDECQAYLLSIKLKYLNKWNIQRQNIAKKYLEELKEIDKNVLTSQFKFINAKYTETVTDGNKINLDIYFDESKKLFVNRINLPFSAK